MRVRPTRVRRLRIRKAIGNVTLAAVTLAGASLYLALVKNVTLVVNGRPEAVRTLSANVGELLDTRGIALSGGVLVEPPPATPLADGMTVVVDTALPEAPSEGVGVWVMEGVDGPFVQLMARSIEAGFSAGSVGPSRTVVARVVVRGKDHDVLTNATTVRDLLSAMGIRPDGDDRVRPSLQAPLHAAATVVFDKVTEGVRQIVVPIPFRTITTYTSDLPPGRQRVTRPGQSGSMLEVFHVRWVNGRLVSKTLVSRRVTREPVAEHMTVGRASTVPAGTEVGEASWYDAPGTGLTAAHPWLPFGTVVTVTNLADGRSVRVVINDRGPFGGRIIDLSPEAFSRLASLGTGVIDVRISW
ncbi:MAG: ubiquitin-like domain-containing protein [Candidatus Velamenicoccus archaeovorus]